MQEFYGTKVIKAKSMTLGVYNKLRGWDIPEDEDPRKDGYLVEYLDGGPSNHPDFENYISWSPAQAFQAAYQPTSELSFGHAIKALKAGKKVSRAGWNGKGMFVYYVDANKYPASRNTLKTMDGVFENDMVPYREYLALKTVNDEVVPWVATQSDILSDDWCIVE